MVVVRCERASAISGLPVLSNHGKANIFCQDGIPSPHVCLFVCFGGVSKAGEIGTLPKTSLPVAGSG
jgi:hypothetical protein